MYNEEIRKAKLRRRSGIKKGLTMHIQPIGKGKSRIVVKSEKRRECLSKLPGVQVFGERVIIPERYESMIRKMGQKSTRPQADAIQTDLFID